MFTDGKSQFYEGLMQVPPHGKPRPSGIGKKKFRYKYADVSCDYCLHAKQCKGKKCFFIMDNLDDLRRDRVFRNAIENADTCDNKHKATLTYLRDAGYLKANPNY